MISNASLHVHVQLQISVVLTKSYVVFNFICTGTNLAKSESFVSMHVHGKPWSKAIPIIP